MIMSQKTIADVLRNCPLNKKLYSTAYGDLLFKYVKFDDIVTFSNEHNKEIIFDRNGYLCYGEVVFSCTVKGMKDGGGFVKKSDSCLLFPCRGNHTWENWRSVLFDQGDILFDDVRTNDAYQFVAYDDIGWIEVENSKAQILSMPISHFRFASFDECEKFYNDFTTSGDVKKVEPSFGFDKTKYFCKQEESEHDPKFKPYDKVIIRNDDNDSWKATFYSHGVMNPNGTIEHYTTGCTYCGYWQCLPYNDQTKHLIGTANKP